MSTVPADARIPPTGAETPHRGAGTGATWLSVESLVGAVASGACCVIPWDEAAATVPVLIEATARAGDPSRWQV
jgi:hypothetical protein